MLDMLWTAAGATLTPSSLQVKYNKNPRPKGKGHIRIRHKGRDILQGLT